VSGKRINANLAEGLCTSDGQTEVVVGIELSWQVVDYQTRKHEGNGNEKSCRMSIVRRLEPRGGKVKLSQYTG
jgi:hypothetical protein